MLVFVDRRREAELRVGALEDLVLRAAEA